MISKAKLLMQIKARHPFRDYVALREARRSPACSTVSAL